MKKFTKDVQAIRQGEVYFVRINKLPKNIKPATPTDGRYIVAHSETGHHHVIAERPTVQYFTTDSPTVSYLQVIEATDAAEVLLEHLRSFDTHESILFTEGIYCAITGRESVPEGWRKVQD